MGCTDSKGWTNNDTTGARGPRGKSRTHWYFRPVSWIWKAYMFNNAALATPLD